MSVIFIYWYKFVSYSNNPITRSNKEYLQRMLKRLGADEIEKIVGYKFKEKSFLLEAFTHPSYEDNR